MERDFQNDLNGILEHLSVNSPVPEAEKSTFVNLCKLSFDETLRYYANIPEAKKALHTVLFRFLTQQKEKNNFSVSRYKRTFEPSEYFELEDYFGLFKHTIHSLYRLSPERGSEVCQELLSDLIPSQHQLLPAYLRICFSISNEKFQTQALDFFIGKCRNIPDDSILSDVLSILHRQLRMLITKTTVTCDNTENICDSERAKTLAVVTSAVVQTDTLKPSCQKPYSVEKLARETLSEIEKHMKKMMASSYKIDNVCLKRKSIFSGNNIIKKRVHSTETLDETSILDSWNNISHNTTLTKSAKHKYAFISICRHIKDHREPRPPLLYRENITSTVSNDDRDDGVRPIKEVCEMLIRDLSLNTTHDSLDRTLLYTKIWCLGVLRDESGGWRSVLKVMIQFCDLWINEMTNNSALDTFAVLISDELVKDLYKQVKRLVNIFEHYGEGPIQLESLKKMCLLLQKSFRSIPCIQDLLVFRDYVLRTEKSKGFIEDPTYSRLDIWTSNFEAELMKATNQIVIVQENEVDNDLVGTTSLDKNVPKELVHNLASLSIIWPYSVLQELVLLCFQNRNMYLAIVPLLRSLGSLCSFRKNSGVETMLGSVLKDILHSNSSAWTKYDAKNITTFITSCCQDPFNPETPPLLLACRPTEVLPGILLNAREYLESHILDSLDCFSNDRVHKDKNVEVSSFRLSLQILNELSTSKAVQRIDWIEATKAIFQSKTINIENIAILQAKPFEFLRSFCLVMDMRNTFQMLPEWIRVQEVEAALKYFKRLASIITQTIGWLSQKHQSTHINFHGTADAFIESLKNDTREFLKTICTYDWKTQLQLYDLHLAAVNLFEKKQDFSINVPGSIYSITGSLNGRLFLDKSADVDTSLDDKLQGWNSVIGAAKLSDVFSDLLFEGQNKDYWINNMALPQNYPFEFGAFIEGLYQNLYPTLSLSVHDEYERLLVHFIGRLFESFDLQILRDNLSKEPEQILYIKQLTTQELKDFYRVMLGARLINYKSFLSAELLHKREDELYYVSGIIRSIQTIKDWTDLRSSRLKIYAKRTLSDKLIHEILGDKALLEENLENRHDVHRITAPETCSEITLEQTSIESSEQDGYVCDIYYPFWDKKQHSARALSILTLMMLCKSSALCNTVEAQEVIRVLILQIVDGLRETETKQEFNRLVSGQARSRVEKWRKHKKFKKRIVLRPILNPGEEELISSCVSCLTNSNQANGILKALEITDKPQTSKSRKEQAFYLRL